MASKFLILTSILLLLFDKLGEITGVLVYSFLFLILISSLKERSR